MSEYQQAANKAFIYLAMIVLTVVESAIGLGSSYVVVKTLTVLGMSDLRAGLFGGAIATLLMGWAWKTFFKGIKQ